MPVELVVFDVDGTLTRHSSIWWRLHEHFKTTEEGQKFYNQYFAGEISYQEWADLDAGLWTGKPLSEVIRVVEETKLVEGARETVQALKENGIHTAILSGGLDVMANSIAERVGIDYVLTNRLLHENGILTGAVDILVGWGEKINEVEQITAHFNIPLESTAFVGDGRNDLSVFSVVGLSIAFMPEDQEVAAGAMVQIKEPDLRFILPYVISGLRRT